MACLGINFSASTRIMKAILRLHLVVFALLAAGGMPSPAATVPEPSTVIYGKVLHRANGSEHRLTEGSLVWTLRDQNGATYAYTAELEDIKGTFSYRISIPHQALASGLSVDSSVIPLRNSETRYDFVSIQLDGSPAAVISTGSDFLKMLQRSRAATHRIDLQVFSELADSDGDGMPDWWEILHGLDWQVADGHLDRDGDGWTNLAEYRNGSDPNQDNRAPTLHTTELATYRESSNGVWLRAMDADTAPAGLVYTLTELPGGGDFHLNEGEPTARVMRAGDSFTQHDLHEGRLTFRHVDPKVRETFFSVTLSDGVNAPYSGSVAIRVFPPDSPPVASASVKAAPEWWRDENAVFEAYWGMRENVLGGEYAETVLLYLMGRNYGWTVWDQRSHTLPVSLQANGKGSHFILGGEGDDVLVGSGQDDILSGGRGTNRLRGGGGRDLFMVNHPGLEIIEDFSTQHDVLDLSGLLHGKAGSLNSFLQTHFNGSHTEIRVNRSGGGGSFSDATVRLEGIELSQDGLHQLWARGQLLLGAVQGFPVVSIEGWPSAALEEGFSAAELVLRRQGPVNQALTVSLAISGSATNGVDYTTLPSTVTFGVGKRSVPLLINPLTDGAAEFTEVIQLSLAPGSHYVSGVTAGGQISIIDAKQRFNILPVDDFAVADGEAGYLRIVRQGPRNGAVELLLSFSGSAVRNVDYSAIPAAITFSDQQASRLIPVQALALGELAGSEKSKLLTVSIRPAFEEEYLLGQSPSATMRLISEKGSFEEWVAEVAPAATTTGPTSGFTNLHSPRTGLSALLEYASSYGLNLRDGVSEQERTLLTPRLARDEGGWHFEFSKRLNDPRLEYIVERSADLITWRSDPAFFKPMALTAAKENAGRVRYRVIEPEGAPLPFMRLRVNLKD
jgi:hypothetical protein